MSNFISMLANVSINYTRYKIIMNYQDKIDSVARELCENSTDCTCGDHNGQCLASQHYAKIIVDLGYAKERDVVAELIAEIEDVVNPASKSFESFMLRNKLHKLKEKYEL